MGCEVLVARARPAGKLDDEAFAHEISSILTRLGNFVGMQSMKSYIRKAVGGISNHS